VSGVLAFLFILSGVFVLLIIVGVFWSIRSGQFDDMEGPAERILMDDDDPRLPGRKQREETEENPGGE
jgi:cbb3-type cytochrome oxidase maturation protein